MSKKRTPKSNARALVNKVQTRIDSMRAPREATPAETHVMQRIQALRTDDWKNLLTGYGTGRDKSRSNLANADLVSVTEAEEIWRASSTADRVVSTEPEEMFREGFTLHIQDEDEQSASEFSFKDPRKEQELAIKAEAAKNGTPAPFGGDKGKAGGKGAPPPFGKFGGKKDAADPLEEQKKKKALEESKSGGDRPAADPAEQNKESPNESEDKPTEEGDRPLEDPADQPEEGEEGAAETQQNTEVELGHEEEGQTKEQKENEGDDLSDSMLAYAEELGVVAKVQEAEQYRRAYGGALLFLGCDDGQDPIEPLNAEAVKSFTWINVLMPLEVQPATWYEDASAPKYGEPKTYRITQIGGTNQATREVHESRCIRLVGAQVSRLRTRELNGWGDSVFVRTKKAIADFDVSYGSAAVLLSEFSQTIISFKGLAEWVATNGTEMLRARIEAIDMARSVLKATVVDADGETVERKATTVTGLPELLDRMGNRLAADARIPVTILMGQAPAGLNATGASDVRAFYARISAMRIKHAKPVLERIIKLMFLNRGGPAKGQEPENWQVKFPPLWQETQTEIVANRKAQAEIDEKYIMNEVLMPEEVARARFGGADYSFDTKVDFDLRKQLSSDEPAVDEEGNPIDPLPGAKIGPDGKLMKPKLGPDGKPLPVKAAAIPFGKKPLAAAEKDPIGKEEGGEEPAAVEKDPNGNDEPTFPAKKKPEVEK